VADTEGIVFSLTSSNGSSNGHVCERTGIMGNNFLGEDDLNPLGFLG